MLHFCFSSAVYETIVIVFPQRLLPFCFARILIFAREIFAFSLYIAMSENYTWREELKAHFQLKFRKIHRPCPIFLNRELEHKYKNTAKGIVKMERAKASHSEYLLPGTLASDCIKFTRYV